MTFVKVAELNELWDGEMKGVIVDGQKIVLINNNNTIYALEDRCLHQEVELSQGVYENGILTCSAHRWQYNIAGCGLNPKGIQLKSFAVKISDGCILIDVNQLVEKRKCKWQSESINEI